MDQKRFFPNAEKGFEKGTSSTTVLCTQPSPLGVSDLKTPPPKRGIFETSLTIPFISSRRNRGPFFVNAFIFRIDGASERKPAASLIWNGGLCAV